MTTPDQLKECGWCQVDTDNSYGVQRWEREKAGKVEILHYDPVIQRITGYYPVKEG